MPHRPAYTLPSVVCVIHCRVLTSLVHFFLGSQKPTVYNTDLCPIEVPVMMAEKMEASLTNLRPIISGDSWIPVAKWGLRYNERVRKALLAAHKASERLHGLNAESKR